MHIIRCVTLCVCVWGCVHAPAWVHACVRLCCTDWNSAKNTVLNHKTEKNTEPHFRCLCLTVTLNKSTPPILFTPSASHTKSVSFIQHKMVKVMTFSQSAGPPGQTLPIVPLDSIIHCSTWFNYRLFHLIQLSFRLAVCFCVILLPLGSFSITMPHWEKPSKKLMVRPTHHPAPSSSFNTGQVKRWPTTFTDTVCMVNVVYLCKFHFVISRQGEWGVGGGEGVEGRGTAQVHKANIPYNTAPKGHH